MGRPLRLDAPGCWHHVMNRGAGRRIVFRDDDERAVFVDLLAELDARFGVEVHAYCLMGNHYHLLVRSRDGDVSAAMKWLGAAFTLGVNSRRGVDGAIFRGRFHSVLIRAEAHLTWFFRYINANPVDLGWQRRLAEYPWSGLATSLGERHDQPWLRADHVLARFGSDRRRLERFVESAREIDSGCPDVVVASDVEVAAAVDLARRPGPEVASTAQARTAHTLVATAAGLTLDEISTIAHLPRPSRLQYLERARIHHDLDPVVAALVQRTRSVLAVCQMVSDTV
ncbi:MAG: transposase [Ilumatobacter sp.]|uniref:transposase n=1 Tax=Ilumatobacter sp. TaxID=1967498 RepID=UPI003298DFD4